MDVESFLILKQEKIPLSPCATLKWMGFIQDTQVRPLKDFKLILHYKF